MHRHVAGKYVSQTPLRQQGRAAQANESGRFPAQLRHTIEGRLSAFDCSHTSFKEVLAGFSHSQGTSGALEQADTEPLLQRSDAPAEARFLHADSSCRRRKAPVLDDRSKEVDVVQIIHRLLLVCINLLQRSHLAPNRCLNIVNSIWITPLMESTA